MVFLCIGLLACTTSRVVKPLNQGEVDIALDLGGPIFNYNGTDIPLPLSSISTAYGLNQNTSLYGGIHTTAIAYGVAQLDLGATLGLYEPEGYLPGFSLSPAVNMSLDTWEYDYHVSPSVDFNFYWNIPQSHDFFYIGSANWFEISGKRAHGEDQPSLWVPAIHGGYTWLPGKFRLTVETKYLAPFHSNKNITIDYYGPFDKGTLGVYFTLGYRL